MIKLCKPHSKGRRSKYQKANRKNCDYCLTNAIYKSVNKEKMATWQRKQYLVRRRKLAGFNKLLKVIKEYDSDTFYGGNLTDRQAIKLTNACIEYCINNLDGVTLSQLLEDLNT